MKLVPYILVAFMILQHLLCQAQNHLLQGEVTEQNTGRPLSRIEIKSYGAADVTDDFGVFQLEFASKKPGDKIELWVTDPAGRMMVVNKKQLDGLNLPYRADDGVRIVMADRDEYLDAQQRFYGVILESSKASAEAQRKELRAQLKQANQTMEEHERLLSQIKRLEEDTRQIEQRAEELATYLASIDLNQASDLQKEALAHVERGQVDSALLALDEQRLEAAYQEAAKQKAGAVSSIHDVIGSFALEAEIYRSRGEFDKAAIRWRRIASLREESLPAEKAGLGLAYVRAGYLRWQGGDSREGKVWLEKGMEVLATPSIARDTQMVSVLVELSDNLYQMGEIELARQKLILSLEIRKEVMPADDPDLGIHIYNLGLLSAKLGNDSAAIIHFEKVLSIWQKDASQTRVQLLKLEESLAGAHGRLGIACRDEGELENALIHFKKACVLDTRKAVYVVERGRCYRELDRLQEARRDFQQGARLDAGYRSQEFHSDLGLVALREEGWAAAREAFDTFKRGGGAARQGFFHEAVFYAYQGKIKESLAALELATQAGWNQWQEIERDPHLEKLRKSSGYKRLAKKQ